MNEQERVDIAGLRRRLEGGWLPSVAEGRALLAVVDAARAFADNAACLDPDCGNTVCVLNAALEPFAPAEEEEARLPWIARQPTYKQHMDLYLDFNERMQERERQRRLADLGIRVVDPDVSDAVSSGAGGRPVSLPGAENGPQIPSRPASLDREQIRRDAELWRDATMADSSGNALGVQTLAHYCLTLLAELEQADERERDGAKNFLVQLDLRKAAEARLARVPALVEACRAFDEHVTLNGGCHRGCPEHDALRAALAEWEQA